MNCIVCAQDQAGADEAVVDDLRSALQHRGLALHGASDLAVAGGGAVADVALDQRPDTYLRVQVA